jgi:hypothetical protein
MVNGTRPMPKETASSIAEAFGLPSDYFAEYRAAIVIEAVRTRPSLLDQVYDELR